MKYASRLLMVSVAAIMCFAFTSCEKDQYSIDDLVGTWVYDTDNEYSVTFKADGNLTYTAPDATSTYYPTYTLDGKMIYIRVKIGSTSVDDVLEIKTLSSTKLIVYYDGDILFDGESLTGEYSCTRK